MFKDVSNFTVSMLSKKEKTRYKYIIFIYIYQYQICEYILKKWSASNDYLYWCDFLNQQNF